MSTATNPVPNIPPAKPRRKKPGRAVVIQNIDWKTYTRLLKAFGDRPRLRLTYDRGNSKSWRPATNTTVTPISFPHWS